MRIRRTITQLAISILLISFAFNTGAVDQVTIENAKSNWEKNGKYEEYLKLVKELRAHIDRSLFDLDSLLQKLDYEEEKIIDFVKSQIRYEPYAGLLRGASGTLQSRSGNSLDQSVLLATLLNNAGYEARIVRGTLNPHAAESLIKESMSFKQQAPPLGDLKAIEQTLQKMQELYGESVHLHPVNNFDKNLMSRVQNQKEWIVGALRENGFHLGGRTEQPTFVGHSTDYFWVELRSGAASPWLAVHPSTTAAAPEGGPLEPSKVLINSIPADLQHRIRIEAFISHRVGSKERISRVMSTWERPAANLIDTPITYANFPLGLANLPDWTSSEYQDKHKNPYEQAYKDALATSSLMAPMLNGRTAPGALYFDLHGNLVPPSEAASFMAPLFQELGSKVNRAASALGALGGTASDGEPPPALMALTAQWLEITLIKPGQPDEKIKRMLISNSETASSGLEGVGQQVEISLSTGRISTALWLDSVLAEIENAHTQMQGMLFGDPTGKKTRTSRGGSAASKKIPLDSSSYFRFADHPIQEDSSSHIYRSEPSIVAKYRHVWLNDKSYRGFDIINNTRTAFTVSNDKIALAPSLALQAGILETLVETIVSPFGRADLSNTFLNFESLASPPFPKNARVLSDPASAFVHEDKFGTLKADLDAGYVLVLLPEDDENDMPYTWWRVNPNTGETLGMLSIGWGGISIEKTNEMLIALFEINETRFASAVAKCEGILAIANIIAAVSTGNIIDTFFEGSLVAKIAPVVGYGLASLVQASMMTGNHGAFMAQCVPKVFMTQPL